MLLPSEFYDRINELITASQKEQQADDRLALCRSDHNQQHWLEYARQDSAKNFSKRVACQNELIACVIRLIEKGPPTE